MEFMKLSREEISSGKLAPETLQQAVNQVKLNGYVVIENAISDDLADELNSEFLSELNRLMKTDSEKTEVNTTEFRTNRVRMDLPFREPFIRPEIITNPFALQVVDQIVGEDCRCVYLSVDAPLPGSEYQAVHGDYAPFYPESDMVMPITGLVVNFPLIDFTEDNGPLEAWPNTHLIPEKSFTGSYVQDAAKCIDPVRMLLPKGSIIIRDVRMWHRGTPNNSNEIRPNVALIYTRQWWDGAYYPQENLGITKETYIGLSERAQQLLRYEKLIDLVGTSK
jgi:ectoine hydroxylase-related dioxygenase (phytanoyl-CoA dioxygenase family)